MNAGRPLVHIGLLVAVRAEEERLPLFDDGRDRLQHALAEQLPRFEWQVTLEHRRRFSPLGALDPLALVEFGVQEKIQQGWDYAVVLVPNEIALRDRAATWGLPSSALEVAVISTETIAATDAFGDEIAARALHLLGHLWGLEHADAGPMHPGVPRAEARTRFPPEQLAAIVSRLEEVADARIEEEQRGGARVSFYWRAFYADPRGIATDIWGYAPWRVPFRLGRLTAGAFTFVIILLLTSESWQVGTNVSPAVIAVSTAGAILAAASFLFVGQNLGKMSGPGRWQEQLVRTQIVIFGSLLAGMGALWAVLALLALAVGLAMPDGVLREWLTQVPDFVRLCRHSAFMAAIGLFGGALGGNLEDEDNFKAKFLFDEDA